MAKCAICEKAAHFGNGVSHSHRRSNKIWKANVKSVKVKVNGGAQKMYVCTSCLDRSRRELNTSEPDNDKTKACEPESGPYAFFVLFRKLPPCQKQEYKKRPAVSPQPDRSCSLSACLFTVHDPPRSSRMPAVSVTGRENTMALALVSGRPFP